MKAYKIRKFQNGRNSRGEPFLNYSLTLPSNIATALPPEVSYTCELTEEGILFRPAEPQTPNEDSLPSWARR